MYKYDYIKQYIKIGTICLAKSIGKASFYIANKLDDSNENSKEIENSKEKTIKTSS